MIRIIEGDCRAILPTLTAEAFDCVVTSPPYWGLRDYGCEGQIGLEPTLEAYIETLRAVAMKLWRVLKPSGTFWLNLGDCYAGSGGKPKDLCMVPHRAALALQTDGWWVRSAVVWHKPNPMPESATDRPTSAYEMVFLLTKSAIYFYDAEAIAEDGVSNRHKAMRTGAAYLNQEGPQDNTRKSDKQRGRVAALEKACSGTRNARNVWTIATHPFKGSHFATMPPDLAERCIKAGCPRGGHVLDPFGGAGTTGMVADRLGRGATLIELSPAYCSIGARRVSDDSPLFADVV